MHSRRAKEKTVNKNRNGIKLLNAPRSIEVRVDKHGTPTSIRAPQSQSNGGVSVNSSLLNNSPANADLLISDGRWITVSDVLDLWKINDEWWRGSPDEISRLYYRLRLRNGRQTTIFLDLNKSRWFRQAG